MGEEADPGSALPGPPDGDKALDLYPGNAGSESPQVRRQLTMTDDDEDATGLLQDARMSSLNVEKTNGETMAETWNRIRSNDEEPPLLPSFTRSAVARKTTLDSGNKNFLVAILLDAKDSAVHMALGNKMNVLLVCVPFAIVSHKLGWGSGLTAVLSLLALCPLAERLGFITEQLALRTNDTLGALLNVTFGNATELILSIAALNRAELTLIQMSLIGSILSNQFLVLGSAMVIGGIKHKVQLFERQSAVLHITLLIGSSLALAIPMVLLWMGGTQEHAAVTWLSRFISVIMITTYGLFLYYILRLQKKMDSKNSGNPLPQNTPEKFSILHKSVLNRSSMDRSRPKNTPPNDVELGRSRSLSADGSGRSFDMASIVVDDEDDEEEVPVLSTWSGIVWLGLVAVLISYMSDLLVDNIEAGAAEQLHMPPGFLYTIIVPIVGNAAEHTSALIFSYRNKPDIAFGIAVGSSVQIALLVIPACVLIAWPMRQDLTLFFGNFETCVYAASVILLFTVISDGRSNWMKGALLISAYLMISLGVWFN